MINKKINVKNTVEQEAYWSQRYKEDRTGWDIGYPSTPLKSYIDQLENKELKILIPGAGNSYEAEYLFQNGFKRVHVLDISEAPLDSLRKRVPDFPEDQTILANFFDHEEKYDLILEQTFLCSFPPTQTNRAAYAKKMHQLLNDTGKLVGLWFDIPLTGDMEKRPFGGTKEEYLGYLSPYFEVKVFEPCKNSIKPRSGTELFGIFSKNTV